MSKIQLRLHEIVDAKRFYEILSNPNFTHLNANPKSVEDEENWIKSAYKDLASGLQYNFTILYNEEVIGGAGIKINFNRKYIGEMGYFIDEKYWGKGIATEAVKLLEEKCFNELKLKRIEILMKPENKGSEKVAIKAGYSKEGLLKKALEGKDGEMHDAHIYAKTL